LSAYQLLATPARGTGHPATIGVLEDFLRDCPRTPAEIWEAAQSLGFSDSTLKRARKALHISATRVGKGKDHRSYWRLEGQPLPGRTAATRARFPPERQAMKTLAGCAAMYPSLGKAVPK
jgi:hypothetical protein